MRVARQWSLCHDDALDAFQRGLEIFVRRMDTVEPATEAAWLKVVIRHEAMAIRRARSDCVADPDLDLDGVLPAPQRSVEEQVLSGDRVSRSAEALRALKPDEARALMLKAHGMSYEEIGRHCGWTYTKVNRAITEGRRRFMQVYAALEAGSECERFAPLLRALAAGTATSEQLLEIRPHLRRCVACRATVRDLHRGRLPILLPLPAVAASLGWLRERFGGSGLPPQIRDVLGPGATPELAPHVDVPEPLPDAREVIQQAHVEERLDRLRQVKEKSLQLAHRTNSSDLAAGIHIAATSGGGRIATLGAIVGLCLSGIGAGTVCVVTGVLHHSVGPRMSRPSTPHTRQSRSRIKHASPHSHDGVSYASAAHPAPIHMARPSPQPKAPKSEVAPQAPSRPAVSHAPATTPDPEPATTEFGFETTASSTSSTSRPSQAATASQPTPGASEPASPPTSPDPAQEEFGP